VGGGFLLLLCTIVRANDGGTVRMERNAATNAAPPKSNHIVVVMFSMWGDGRLWKMRF
jgi:hypothetical protein